MSNEEIEYHLSQLHTGSVPLIQFADQLQSLKEACVIRNDQAAAKQLWIYQTVLGVHQDYIDIFNDLQGKKYYPAWCALERLEKLFHSLKRHFEFDKTQYWLWQIEKTVKNLQVLFPYRMFASTEFLYKKKQCSVCKQEVSIRKSCGHIAGEIYDGKMCRREITECDVLGISLVTNPNNKYSVMFLTDDKTGETYDQYDYSTLKYLFELIESPYDEWDLEVSQRIVQKSEFPNIGRNDLCNCESGKKFKHCCWQLIGTNAPHYEFILKNPSDETRLVNTVKKRFITEYNRNRRA